MTVDEIIKIVKVKEMGRTRYEGQEPYWDEILVNNILHLRAKIAELVKWNGSSDANVAQTQQEDIKQGSYNWDCPE